MHIIINKLVQYCINHNFARAEDIPWLRYSLEKRITSIVTLIPFFILAIYMTSIPCAIAFFICFYSIRSRSSGFHMHNAGSCFVMSLALDYILTKYLYPLLNDTSIFILTSVCATIIFFLAPYKHPNMNFTKEELQVCRSYSRIIICNVSFATIICVILSATEIAKGATMGILLSAFLLCLGYITNMEESIK